jgi:hypothetical protein
MTPKVYGEGFAVMPAAILTAEVSSHAKVLWGLLRLHASPEGRCYPSRTLLAKLMGVSVDTVKRAKAELVKAKLIEVHARYDESGRRTSDDVILPHPRSTGAPYVRSTDAPTEVEPEEETPRYEVASGVTSIRGGKNDTPAPTCSRCGAAGLLLRTNATVDKRDFHATGGTLLCPTCYERPGSLL